MKDSFESALVAFGSNYESKFGSPRETILYSIEKLQEKSTKLLKVSDFYLSQAFPAGNGPDYVNAVAKFQTKLNVNELMIKLHQIENLCERKRFKRWGSRTLDLDLISFGNQIIPNTEGFLKWANLSLKKQYEEAPASLILPHPRIQDRLFVLLPLRDVALNWSHPVFKKNIEELLSNFSEKEHKSVKRIKIEIN